MRDHSDIARALAGYGITTAEILYHLPDTPSILQVYVWQEYDLHPRFPRLKGFLDFWNRTLDGGLYQVRVAHVALIQPAEVRIVAGQLRLN